MCPNLTAHLAGVAHLEGYQLILSTFLALVAGGIAIAVLAGVVVAIFGKQRRNLPLMIAGTVVAALPFLGFAWSSVGADLEYSSRIEEIAEMRRHPLPQDYPRTAVVLGGSVPRALFSYLLLGELDEIRSDAWGPRGVSYKLVSDVRECRDLAYASLQRTVRRNPGYSDNFQAMRACMTERDMEVSEDTLPADALMIRRDGDARNKPANSTIWSGGIVEIAIRQGGEERLIDYAERPLIEKSRSPFLPLAESLDTGGSPDPDRMIAAVFGLPPPLIAQTRWSLSQSVDPAGL